MPPILIRNHLHPDTSAQPLLLVDGTRVVDPDPPLTALIGGFVDDGNGSLVAPARSTHGVGYLDGAGRWIVAPTLQDARSFSEDGLARFQLGDLWGFLDLQGKIVIEPQFEDAKAFRCGRAPVKNGKYWRYIDTTGATAFEGVFTRAEIFSACGLASARPSGKAQCGYIDEGGNWAIVPQFSHALDFTRDGVAPVQIKGERYGLIDVHGNWIVQPAYSRIAAFAGGYAYCRIDRYGRLDDECYIDTSGRVVIPQQEDLAEWLADGWVKVSDWKYVGPGGELSPSVHIGWGSHFTGHGFAIAAAYRGNADGPFEEGLIWGILGADGQFHRPPDDVLEPLTDDDADILWPEPGTPLVPFVTSNEDVAFLDQKGRVAYRLQRQSLENGECVILCDAQGIALWSSAPAASVARVVPFFAPEPASFVPAGVDCARLPELADDLLRRAQEQLARLATGEPLRDESGADHDAGHGRNGDWGEDRQMPYPYVFEDDNVDSVAASTRAARRVWRVYLNEGVWGTYEFLSDLRLQQRDTMYARMAAALTERFGQPAALPEDAARMCDVTGLVWPIGSGAQRYWLGLSTYCDAGDGTWWSNIWMHCTPGIEALEAASALAPAGDDDGDGDDDEWSDDDDDAEPDEPQPRTRDEWVAQVGGYADWLELVCGDGRYLREVPAPFLDDAMVDAALEANPGAYEYVPAAFQTPARLEALIRKGSDVATRIPRVCMTAEGLALARSLYVDEPDWNYRDLRSSSLPDEALDLHRLQDVWGGLIDADLALRAVRAGVSLEDIPRWLRSEAVIEVALDKEILNVRWLDPKQFTPAIAARAVRESDYDLLEYIPREFVTPELCLAAVTGTGDGSSLKYVPTECMTVPLCVAAVQTSEEAMEYVPDALREAVLAALEGNE